MFGVFEVWYFGVRSKTNMYQSSKVRIHTQCNCLKVIGNSNDKVRVPNFSAPNKPNHLSGVLNLAMLTLELQFLLKSNAYFSVSYANFNMLN